MAVVRIMRTLSFHHITACFHVLQLLKTPENYSHIKGIVSGTVVVFFSHFFAVTHSLKQKINDDIIWKICKQMS